MECRESSEKVNLVRSLMQKGRYKVLRDLLLGVSEHNVGVAFESDPPLQVVKLVSRVRSHLQFLDLFGNATTHQIVDGTHYLAYPDSFEQWLDADAPGVTLEELRRCCSHGS